MKFFRNPEIQRQFAVSALLLILLTGTVGLTAGRAAGTALLSGGFFMLLLWLIFTYRRYGRLERLAADMDRILHGERDLNLKRYQEGEYAILANEVQKLLLRLTEQSEVLQREKDYLSDSLADISHQLRTPLTSLQLLLSRIPKEQEERERRRLTYEGIQLLNRINWLVEALLKISRIDAGRVAFEREYVEAEALVEKALEPLGIALELHGKTVERTIQKGAGCHGDFAWMAEALGNILKNCMEYTREGGVLSVTASENHLYTEFVIEDEGPGIDPEDLPHLFERFYKGKHASDSSIGIGLALSRMIIRAQNGTVKAENRPEGGARFTVRFYKGII